jgi:choline dehydrogenase-like flavoprotein
MNTMSTDILIIGSGFGAAPPALRLSEAGLQVLMIEKGPESVEAPKAVVQPAKVQTPARKGVTSSGEGADKDGW